MSVENCPPYPHHSWLAHWIGVHPPAVFDAQERRQIAHHLLLTTRGEADIVWRAGEIEQAYHTASGGIGFFPCDHLPHSMSITSADGFTAHDLIIPEVHLRTARPAGGAPPIHELRAMPVFRDMLLEAGLVRLSMPAGGRQIAEDIGDEIAARQVLLRLCVLAGLPPPDWQWDASVFTPAMMRQLVVGIDAHLATPMSLETLADTARLSPGHFARKFRRSAGLSLSRFVNVRRIAASFVMLRQAERALAGIALDLGFSSQSHFTRLFSGLTGFSPDQFRRQHRRMDA